MKRIMLIISSLSGGGAERVTANLSAALSDQYKVCVVTLFGNKDSDAYTLDDRVELYRYTDYWEQVPRLVRKIKNLLKPLPRVLWTRKMKREWKPDVTISLLIVPNIVNVLTNVGDFRIVSERADPQKIGGSYYRYTRFSLSKADHVVFQSKRVQHMFSQKVQAKSSIILNPVSVSAIASPKAEKRIVTAGRLADQKNHRMLIRVFARFHESHPDYTLEIYGKGPLRDSLDQLIHDLHLSKCAFVHDFAPDLHKQIQTATMFVLPSDYEGLSNALLEAMMMGLPCISTDCAGSDEVIEHGKNGLLIPVGDENALYEAMVTLAESATVRETLSKGALESSLRFQRDTVLRQWIELIEAHTGE